MLHLEVEMGQLLVVALKGHALQSQLIALATPRHSLNGPALFKVALT